MPLTDQPAHLLGVQAERLGLPLDRGEWWSVLLCLDSSLVADGSSTRQARVILSQHQLAEHTMPTNVPLPPPGFDDLSVQEKLDYLESLWDRITANAESIAVPDWHREILDERLSDLQAKPDAGDTWDVVQERLRTKFESQH